MQVRLEADLGLPAIPIAGQGSSELSSLASGTHTLRVWYSGPDHARVALLGTLGETDVITNGTDVWTWSSRENWTPIIFTCREFMCIEFFREVIIRNG